MSGPSVTRTGHVLRPDPTRVVTTMFLPGQEIMTSGTSRAGAVLDRVLGLSDDQVEAALAQVTHAFESRHRDLDATFETRFAMIAHRVAEPESLSRARRRLVGAYFSQEYAVEAAALFNPSMVAHPDQTGLAVGTTRFLMSVRAVGEGHISSAGWRTGTIDAADNLEFDDPGQVLVLADPLPTTFSRAQFVARVGRRGGQGTEAATFVLAGLPEFFDREALDQAMAALRDQHLTRGPSGLVVQRLEEIAAAQYSIRFPADSALGERVIMPGSPAESHGLEDLRLVRFTDADGATSYRATYTAFDGSQVTPALLTTEDFVTFHSQQATGTAAQNKGMALFPRPVGDRYLALSRWDRESTTLAQSLDLSHWEHLSTLQEPSAAWEAIQVGNCGSPIETPAGWLVLTHGVGPVRQYGIGAILLDLDDPSLVLGHLPEPLLTPTADERDGYVPNVVYSCGAMLHGGTLVLPYGCSDSAIRVALVDVDSLLAALRPA